MKVQYGKITSEAQYRQYIEKRQSLANIATLGVKAYSFEINKLTMRIIEWNCRNDKHNPVQTFEKPIMKGPKIIISGHNNAKQ